MENTKMAKERVIKLLNLTPASKKWMWGLPAQKNKTAACDFNADFDVSVTEKKLNNND